jgi:hypothetical protein
MGQGQLGQSTGYLADSTPAVSRGTASWAGMGGYTGGTQARWAVAAAPTVVTAAMQGIHQAIAQGGNTRSRSCIMEPCMQSLNSLNHALMAPIHMAASQVPASLHLQWQG